MLIWVVWYKNHARTPVSRFYIKELCIVDVWRDTKNKRVKSKFSECPNFQLWQTRWYFGTRDKAELQQRPMFTFIEYLLVTGGGITSRGGGGVLPYMGYIGMCGPKGYGFSAVLVINRVSILADFGHFGHK